MGNLREHTDLKPDIMEQQTIQEIQGKFCFLDGILIVSVTNHHEIVDEVLSRLDK